MNMNDAWNTTHLMLRDFVATLPRLIVAEVQLQRSILPSQLIRASLPRCTSFDSDQRDTSLLMNFAELGNGSIVQHSAQLSVKFSVRVANNPVISRLCCIC